MSHKHLTNMNLAHAVCRSRTARERKRNELDAPVASGPKLPEQHSFPRSTSLLAFEPLLRISLSLPKANYALLLGGEGGRNVKWEFVDYGWLVMIRVGATRFATPCLFVISLRCCLRTVSLPDEDELESEQQGSMTNLCQECPRNCWANSWSRKKGPFECYRDFNGST